MTNKETFSMLLDRLIDGSISKEEFLWPDEVLKHSCPESELVTPVSKVPVVRIDNKGNMMFAVKRIGG